MGNNADRNAIVALLQDLYFDEATARSVLINIGYYPARIPAFRSAETFWPEVVLRLEQGLVSDGIRQLLELAARDHPGNGQVKAVLKTQCGHPEPTPEPAPRHRLRVLCLFADPERSSKIRLDREARLLQEVEERGGIELRTRHAVRITDIIHVILREKPQILHFAGHGTQNGRLMFEGDGGVPTAIGAKQFAGAISAAVGILDCVVLNSCYTADNANAFRDTTRALVGSTTAIDDDCALAFTRGFYTGIAAGAAVPDAYATGCAEMNLARCSTSGMHFVAFPAEGRTDGR